jgi:hypothetical protein
MPTVELKDASSLLARLTQRTKHTGTAWALVAYEDAPDTQVLEAPTIEEEAT